jgi:hypothetical protein
MARRVGEEANPLASRLRRHGSLREKTEVTQRPGRPEKPLVVIYSDRPYRKPSLVDRGKYPKVDERSSVKELGKLTPYLRKKGFPALVKRLARGARGGRREQAQATVYQKHRSLRTRKRTYRG